MFVWIQLKEMVTFVMFSPLMKALDKGICETRYIALKLCCYSQSSQTTDACSLIALSPGVGLLNEALMPDCLQVNAHSHWCMGGAGRTSPAQVCCSADRAGGR